MNEKSLALGHIEKIPRLCFCMIAVWHLYETLDITQHLLKMSNFSWFQKVSSEKCLLPPPPHFQHSVKLVRQGSFDVVNEKQVLESKKG